jgi:hypothetical protein
MRIGIGLLISTRPSCMAREIRQRWTLVPKMFRIHRSNQELGICIVNADHTIYRELRDVTEDDPEAWPMKAAVLLENDYYELLPPEFVDSIAEMQQVLGVPLLYYRSEYDGNQVAFIQQEPLIACAERHAGTHSYCKLTVSAGNVEVVGRGSNRQGPLWRACLSQLGVQSLDAWSDIFELEKPWQLPDDATPIPDEKE